MDGSMDELYPTALVERVQHLCFKHEIQDANFRVSGKNPFCGDSLAIAGTIDSQGVMTSVGFTGYGCMICEAGCDLLLEYLLGKKVGQIVSFDQAFMEYLLGVCVPDSRRRCLMLALDTLKTLLERE